MDFTDEHGTRLSERELRELAAYADGSLDADRRAAIARRLERSPALAQLVAAQQRALHAVHASAVDAPASLRTVLESARPPAPARSPRRARIAFGGALAAAAAALTAALVIVLPGGGAAPSLAQAVALAGRGMALPAPTQDASNRQILTSSVDGIHYPYWEQLGWRTRGARNDRIGGRPAVTVYYTDPANRWVAYTIVGGAALSVPAAGATHQELNGTRFTILRAGSRTVVTWLRQGHSCVLSTRDVPVATMLRLAA